MPYTVPTRADFTSRFPVFADSDSALIDRLLAEASASVDESWVEGDYQPAILYLTAHLLATDNSGEGDAVNIGGAGGGVLTSESFGGMSASYATPSFAEGSLSSNDQYGTTEYGRRFLALLKRNVGGPFVA
jgi:hypothetical protein